MAGVDKAAGGPLAVLGASGSRAQVRAEPPVGRRARELLAEGGRLYEAARGVLADHARALEAVRSALVPLRSELVAGELESIPVSRLKDVTEGRLRLGAIEAAGLGSVRAVHEASRYELRQIPGVGAQTADQALAAARQIARAVEETVSVRIDVDRPEPRTTALVVALRRLVEAGPELRRAVDAAGRLDERLGALLPAARPAVGRLRMALAGRHGRDSALAAITELRELTADARARGLRLLLAQASTDLCANRPPTSRRGSTSSCAPRTTTASSPRSRTRHRTSRRPRASCRPRSPSACTPRRWTTPTSGCRCVATSPSAPGSPSPSAGSCSATRWGSARRSRPSPRWRISRRGGRATSWWCAPPVC
ncbi:hypothetical protein ACIPJS_20625 [Streptomyces sp. NPDC086783]|uniref:hypothetical protein n=1 Tax=Streptomyces sp. NPDC086783 TaxID=3365758 RepID=UPI0037FD5BCD